MLIEKTGIEIPQRAIGGVVECQVLAGIEHGDADRQVIERSAVRIEHARQRASHGFCFGGVDADAGAADIGADVEHIEAAARAGDDGGQPARICAPIGARLRDRRPRGAVEQLQAPADGVGGIARFDGARIGGVDESEPPCRIARPGRRRQRFDQCAQRGNLGR